LAARQREKGRECREEMLAPICVPPFPVLPPNNAGKLHIRQKQFYAPQGQHPAVKIPEQTPRRPEEAEALRDLAQVFPPRVFRKPTELELLLLVEESTLVGLQIGCSPLASEREEMIPTIVPG